MDGSAHLYNSNLLFHLIKGDSTSINTFFSLHPAILPNWTSHGILLLFNSFLPAWVAEKILMVFYLSGIAISFRLLVKQLSPDNVWLSVLIFPLSYSYLFHLGFYNYCLSFIFLFFTLYYWLRHKEDKGYLKYFILSFLFIMIYFSALLTFVFLGCCIGLIVLRDLIKEKGYIGNGPGIVLQTVKKFALLFVAALPAIILSILFIKSVTINSSGQEYPAKELMKWLNDVRCIIAFDYVDEERLTEQFLHIMIAIIAFSVAFKFYQAGDGNKKISFQTADIFLIPAFISLMLLFVVPNESNAGMMSDRFCLLIYMFLIVWIAVRPLPLKAGKFFAFAVIILHFGLILKRHNGSLKRQDQDARQIYGAAAFIESNSVVLPVNMSDNWLQIHFSNYLGADKAMVILENYEATVGWFPVKWNTEKIPQVMLGSKKLIPGLEWQVNGNSSVEKQIDYVLLFGKTEKINDANWEELRTELDTNYKLTYRSPNNYIAIFKKI